MQGRTLWVLIEGREDGVRTEIEAGSNARGCVHFPLSSLETRAAVSETFEMISLDCWSVALACGVIWVLDPASRLFSIGRERISSSRLVAVEGGGSAVWGFVVVCTFSGDACSDLFLCTCLCGAAMGETVEAIENESASSTYEFGVPAPLVRCDLTGSGCTRVTYWWLRPKFSVIAFRRSTFFSLSIAVRV